jgi:dihydrofolate reductase
VSAPRVALVVAAAKNGVIGQGGAIPWHLGSDLRRFKALTIGKPTLMGRKTFAAIGRPLPGRPNIVITRDAAFQAEGVEIAHSWPAALARAETLAAASGAEEIAVIGGSEIFAEALPAADRIYLTAVDAAPPGDAFFPPVDPAEWQEIGRETHPAGPRDDHAFVCIDYARRSPVAARGVAAPGRLSLNPRGAGGAAGEPARQP